MNTIQEICIHNSGIDWGYEIEEITFNQDYLIDKLKKSQKLNKNDRLMLSNAVNIIYLSS